MRADKRTQTPVRAFLCPVGPSRCENPNNTL